MPSLRFCPNMSWKDLNLATFVERDSSISKHCLPRIRPMRRITALSFCSCSRLIFRGRSSLSTTPQAKVIHFGKRSSNSLTNTRRAKSRTREPRVRPSARSNTPLAARCAQKRTARKSTWLWPECSTWRTAKASDAEESPSSHLYTSLYSPAETAFELSSQTGLIRLMSSQPRDIKTPNSGTGRTTSRWHRSAYKYTGHFTKQECRMRSCRRLAQSRNSCWPSLRKQTTLVPQASSPCPCKLSLVTVKAPPAVDSQMYWPSELALREMTRTRSETT
mmetsp:Transcript_106713/g.311951  ORF Transcript_106713/g.311951 Transcript_106713/m.311951 type:complete len:276 (-) Transcript_106713:435-1262(-)